MLKFEIDPDSEFGKSINIAIKDVGDLRAPFGLIKQSWFKGNRSIFDENRSSAGKYADLSDKPFRAFWKNKRGFAALYSGGYKEYKKVNVGFTYPILESSGKLKRSITVPNADGAISNITSKTKLELGTDVKSEDGEFYAGHLHFGTRKMPARPVLLLGVEQVAPNKINKRVENWVRMISQYVLDKTEEA